MPNLAVLPYPAIDPVLIQIGPFAVRWYALAYIAGLLFASWYIKRLVSDPALWGGVKPTMTVPQVDDFFVWSILGVVLGGRLGFVLFYKPLYYLSHPVDIFRVWDGGMSFHGGFLGVVVACLLFGRRIGSDRSLSPFSTTSTVPPSWPITAKGSGRSKNRPPMTSTSIAPMAKTRFWRMTAEARRDRRCASASRSMSSDSSATSWPAAFDIFASVLPQAVNCMFSCCSDRADMRSFIGLSAVYIFKPGP